ncbi:MAG TPA: hypothetical protein VHF47_14050 [Acidimicrobiales bacterium]|nr:hypothetical protein [Acidimicrobiales bacterium]
MARQLVLLDGGAADWRLDDATRTTGRQGVAAARAALAAVRPSRPVGDSDTPPPAAA